VYIVYPMYVTANCNYIVSTYTSLVYPRILIYTSALSCIVWVVFTFINVGYQKTISNKENLFTVYI